MKVSIIGTGNMAYHLGKRFKSKGVILNEIIGRNAAHTEGLARILDCDFTTDFNYFKTDSSVYIIAVSDSAIESVAKKLAQNIDNQIITHTSGSIPSSILKPYFKNYGSFYPLQTFSKESQPNFDIIPLFYNANTSDSEAVLKKLAAAVVNKTYHLNDDKRVILHIGAVFVNNFANNLFQAAFDILKKENLPFDVLQPLLIETVKKLETHEPKAVQTGPAQRGDLVTMQKHLDYLSQKALHLVPIYKMLSENINPNIDLD